jgi:hypothetical protein
VDEVEVRPGSLRPIDWGRLDDDLPLDSESILDSVAIDVELAAGECLRLPGHGDAIAFMVAGTVECRIDTECQTLSAGMSIFIPGGAGEVINVAGDEVARLLVVRGTE